MSAVLRPSQILLVGQKIRQIRKSRHLTQAELAGRIGVTQSDLSRMENGEYKVGLDTLFKILQVFELSMSHFFEEGGSDAPSVSREAAPFEDWAALPEETRREVREFIAFKRMQVDKAKADEAETGEDPGDDTNGD
jgi:transcriptional regulator with XRE-family HTH domain